MGISARDYCLKAFDIEKFADSVTDFLEQLYPPGKVPRRDGEDSRQALDSVKTAAGAQTDVAHRNFSFGFPRPRVAVSTPDRFFKLLAIVPLATRCAGAAWLTSVWRRLHR